MQDEPRLLWNAYSRVSADELKLLHAGPHADGPNKRAYVAIGRRDDWNLCSLPVHNGFDNYLPNFIESLLADVLDEDAYATMNCMFRPGRRYSQHPALKDVLGPDQIRVMEAHRSSESIARLNACWVDVDCHQLGLSHGQVIGAVYDLQRDGKLPTPSYLKDSGRGLWIVWLLGRETRSYPEQVTLWRVMQDKLAAMFASNGSDRGSGVDPARLSRIVGSRNSKAEDNKRATMVVFGRDTSGQAIRYTLADLAQQLGIEQTATPKRTKSTQAKLTNKQKGIQGQYQRWKHDESRFWLLVETLRRTVPVGTRNAHNLVIGGILRQRHNYDPDSIHHAIEDAAQRLWKLHPRDDKEYTLEEVRKEIKRAAFGRQIGVRLTARTMADRLKVTTTEAEQIRDLIRTSGKGTWPPATDQEPLTRQKLSRKEVREAVTRYLTAHNWLPGLSDQAVADQLAEETGIELTRETVRRIRKGHRPTPSNLTPQLPLDVDDLQAVLAKARRRHGID